MLYTLPIDNFAQAYGCGLYGEGDPYTGCNAVSEPPSDGGLPGTGTSVLLVVSIAVALICAALLVFWRTRRKR